MKAKRVISILLPLVVAAFIVGCGKHGQLEKEYPEDTPVEDVSVEEPAPEVDVSTQTQCCCECDDCCGGSECSECDGGCECQNQNNTVVTVDCSCDCPQGDDAPDSDSTDEPDDPTDDSDDWLSIILLEFEPDDIFFGYLPHFIDGGVDGDEPDSPRICLGIDDTASHWWLAHLITGGVIDYMETMETVITSEITEDGSHFHMTATSPGGSDVVLEMDQLIGFPEPDGDADLYEPHDVAIKYNNLPATDPVFGYIELTGNIFCSGKAYHYPDSGEWHKYHSCTIPGGSGDSLIFNFDEADYEIIIGLNKKFEGTEPAPENFSFLGGTIRIDSITYDIPMEIPQEVLDCLNKEDQRM